MRGSGRVNLARSVPPGRKYLFPNCSRPESQGRAADRPLHHRPVLHNTWSPTPSASSTQHTVPPDHRTVLHMVPLTIGQFYTWSPAPLDSSTHGPPHHRTVLHMAPAPSVSSTHGHPQSDSSTYGPPHHRTVLHMVPRTIGQFYTWFPPHNRTVLHNTWFPLTIGQLEIERKHNTK